MDHVIDYISEYMYADVEELAKENKSGKYKKLKECPSYEAVKAYCDALRPLYQYMYGKQVEIPTPGSLITGDL